MRKFISISVFSLSLAFCSCEEILFEEDISASIVELLAPGDDTAIKTSTISFRWSDVEGAFFYHLQIATPGFAHPQQIIADTIVQDQFYNDELPEGNYEWRVKALNSGYVSGFSSAAFTVATNEDFSDPKVNLISPLDNYVSNTNNIVLNWGEIEEAVVYRVQNLQDGVVVAEKTTIEPNIAIVFPEGQSTWRVRAENQTRITTYAERAMFVDTVDPETPLLLRPADEADLSVPNVTFEWERSSISGTQEIDSLFVFRNMELSDLVAKEKVNTTYHISLDRGKTYYWFIRSYDTAGNVGDRSDIFSFTVD